MEINFYEIRIVDKLKIFSNGKEVVDHFDKIFEDLEKHRSEEQSKASTVQPVSLLLLDINMPIVTGIEALKQIKEKY